MIITNADYRLVNEENPTKKIEQIARICYKSEDKISDNSDIKMIQNLISRGHTAMLEHANIVIAVSPDVYDRMREQVQIKETRISTEKNKNCYLRFSVADGKYQSPLWSLPIISGNLRAWYEYFEWLVDYGSAIDECVFDIVNNAAGNIFDKFKADVISLSRPAYTALIRDTSELTAKERMIHECFTVVFTVDRGVTHELVRMREASFAQESTRYCNYSKDKFGKEITVIKPCFTNWDEQKFNIWKDSCRYAEEKYFELLDAGASPQEARDVLPTSVKSEIAVTANLTEWYHIFNLRACDATGPAHPQMHEVMQPLFLEQQKLRPFAFEALKIPE